MSLVQGAVEMGMADLKVESLMQRYVAMGRTCQMMESVAQEGSGDGDSKFEDGVTGRGGS